ncbi:peroxidase-like [Anopheles nili]|uniref:peroxidase-like n=1 Tax=Anopheles nili TaxID=185578 RepID=UPI00237BC591|nr:peroxidase-like [Anopheles nili]
MRVLVCVLLVVAFAGQDVLGQCDYNSPYRTFDGTCNNLQNPSWGSANTAYGRLISPEYGDGLSTPRRSKTGVDLPSARLLSLSLFTEPNILDSRMSLLNMQFGQFVAHDMGLRAGGSDPIPCCQNGRVVPSPDKRCFPISVHSNDSILSAGGTQCLDLVRTLNTCDMNPATCTNQQAQQLNAATSFLDLSVVYGNSMMFSSMMRSYFDGRMRVEYRNGTEWPPKNFMGTCSQSSQSSTGSSYSNSCFMTGDDRSSITPQLTILHIAFMREHNRIARQLQLSHSLWDDEKIFQEARRINIAQYQHIVYYEWLPYFLNGDLMKQRGMIGQMRDFVNDYNPNVNPTVLNAHANGAFRYFHSSIVGNLHFFQESRAFSGSININEHMFNPSVLEQNDGYATLTRGMATQPMGQNDWNYDPEIRHYLFSTSMRKGTDLKAIDIQRSRDHGIAGYNAFRQFCGQARATRWEDFGYLRGPADIQLLSNLYRTVDDVDLTVAEFFEQHVPGAQAGPTYHCILMEQFLRTRRGDRFFFENEMTAGAFTFPQLNEIRKASMARILCDSTPGVTQMQRRAFQQVAVDVNPLEPCNSLPTLDARLF